MEIRIRFYVDHYYMIHWRMLPFMAHRSMQLGQRIVRHAVFVGPFVLMWNWR